MRIDIARRRLVLAGFFFGAVACGGSAGAGSGGGYQGRVLAISSTDFTGGVESVFFDLQASFQNSAPAGASPAAKQGCSCVGLAGIHGTVVSGDPGPPEPPPPTAGVLSIDEADGTLLASLSAPANDEAYWTRTEWTPGAGLSVTATGDAVDAFQGTLRTAALPSGITPSLGATPVVVDRSQGFGLSWTPGANPDDTVTLQIQSGCGPSCACTAPVSAGKFALDPTNLAAFDSVTGGACDTTLWLTVTSTSTATCLNATVDLVGQTTMTVPVSFR
jgi:hypothetical protein